MCIASQGGVGETRLKNAQLKLNGQLRKLNFLKDCLQEHVLPPSAPKQLTDGHVPFKRSAREWLKENIKSENLTSKLTNLTSRLCIRMASVYHIVYTPN